MSFAASHMQDALGQFGYWNGSTLDMPSGLPYSMPSMASGEDFTYNPHIQSLCPPSQSLPLSSMEVPFNNLDGLQQPSLPNYSSISGLGSVTDPALLQALQAQLLSAGLGVPAQHHVGHLGIASASVDPLQSISASFQPQYVEALAQANLQAVVQALLHQKLTAAQQIAFLQQLVLKQQDLQPPPAKTRRGVSRSSAAKQRGQSRNSGKKSSPVTGQAPCWADSNWHPLANILAKGSKGAKESGTGVFLPGGPGQTSEGPGNSKMSDSSNSDMSGATLHVPIHQECRC